jgi:hypothetical protein
MRFVLFSQRRTIISLHVNHLVFIKEMACVLCAGAQSLHTGELQMNFMLSRVNTDSVIMYLPDTNLFLINTHKYKHGREEKCMQGYGWKTCSKETDWKIKAWLTAGVCNLYLFKGHILIAERFAGRIHVLQSKVCVLLQDMPTNISLYKYT